MRDRIRLSITQHSLRYARPLPLRRDIASSSYDIALSSIVMRAATLLKPASPTPNHDHACFSRFVEQRSLSVIRLFKTNLIERNGLERMFFAVAMPLVWLRNKLKAIFKVMDMLMLSCLLAAW